VILAAHNAHLLAVESGIYIPADTVLGNAAIDPEVMWSGDCQAYMKDTMISEVRGSLRSPEAPQQIVWLPATIITLPNNLPYDVNLGDILTLQRLSARDAEELNTEKYVVRGRDEGGWTSGTYKFTCMVADDNL
jgi:hypothetical protein